jgi:hypothetical protein
MAVPGIFIPPNGFLGNAQQSQAVQLAVSQDAPRSARSTGSMRKRRTKKRATRSTRASRKRTTKKRTSKRIKLKKGSAAAKAWGAKMRRLRKKK